MVQKEGYQLVQDAYVRYSDIVFEWHQVLDPWQRNAVKALIGANAMVDRNHPLHLPSTEGATLYLGVDKSGARRLLFSLKQLQYLQYYIHEMGLVKERAKEGVDNSWVPLPGAAHLMLADAFTSVEPINLPTAVAVKAQIRYLSRYNKALHNPKALPVPKLSKEEIAAKSAEVEAAKSKFMDAQPKDRKADLPTKVAKSTPAPAKPSAPRRDHGNAIFFHAQQALTIASTGGAMALFKAPDEPAYNTPIGRGLFLALDLTTWELDEDIVLEFGYAAAWFEKKVEFDEEGNSLAKEGEEPEMVLRKERGHWTVQEHLNVHVNGLIKPDNRGHYLFGDTLPIQLKHFKLAVQGIMNDFKRRAGDGASAVTYAIIHSPDSTLEELTKIGLDVSAWSTSITSPVSNKPAYSDPEALGKVVVFDTAELFAAIEFDPEDIDEEYDVPNVSAKSLGEVGTIMFGGDDAKAPSRLDNAGDDAFYNLEAFLAMATGPPLDVLRIDYRLSQNAALTEAEAAASADRDGKDTKSTDNALPTPTSPKIEEPIVDIPEDYITQADQIAANFAKSIGANDASVNVESESEDEMDLEIKGVYFGDTKVEDLEDDDEL